MGTKLWMLSVINQVPAIWAQYFKFICIKILYLWLLHSYKRKKCMKVSNATSISMYNGTAYSRRYNLFFFSFLKKLQRAEWSNGVRKDLNLEKGAIPRAQLLILQAAEEQALPQRTHLKHAPPLFSVTTVFMACLITFVIKCWFNCVFFTCLYL